MNKIEKAFSQITASESLKRRTADYVISQSFSKPQARQKNGRLRLWYAAASIALLLLLSGGLGFYFFNTVPVSYISIDVNPSIELALNRFQRVVSATPFNEDGEAALEALNLEGKTYTEAIEELLADQTFSSYLTPDAALTFTVASSQEEELLSGIQECLDKTAYSASCLISDSDTIAQAHENHLSFGKYRAYLELQQYDASITPDQVRSMTMRQIYDLISQYSGTEVSPPGKGQGAGAQGECQSACESRGGGNGSGQGSHASNAELESKTGGAGQKGADSVSRQESGTGHTGSGNGTGRRQAGKQR